MIEYREVVHLLTKDDEMLDRYSEIDSERGADFLLNDIQQNAYIALDFLNMVGEKQSEGYTKIFELVSAVEFFFYVDSDPQNNKLIKDVAEAIRLYKLRRLI